MVQKTESDNERSRNFSVSVMWEECVTVYSVSAHDSNIHKYVKKSFDNLAEAKAAYENWNYIYEEV